jgi:hypothetical protein
MFNKLVLITVSLLLIQHSNITSSNKTKPKKDLKKQIVHEILKQYPNDEVLNAIATKDLKKLKSLKFDANHFLKIKSLDKSWSHNSYLGIASMLACIEYRTHHELNPRAEKIIHHLLQRGAYPGTVIIDRDGKSLNSIAWIAGFSECPVYDILADAFKKKYDNAVLNEKELAAEVIKNQPEVAPLIKKYLKNDKFGLSPYFGWHHPTRTGSSVD